jgi:hypothetical protein
MLLTGIAVMTGQQVLLLSDSRWWSALGFGLFLTGTLTISFAAHVGYWREQISQQDSSRDSSE